MLMNGWELWGMVKNGGVWLGINRKCWEVMELDGNGGEWVKMVRNYAECRELVRDDG